MSFLNYAEMKQLTNEALSPEILAAKKQLFELRLKKATRQSFKPHMFKHTRRKIAQLLTLESERNKHLK